MNMASPTNNAVLREIAIISFPPAFVLLLIHGVVSNCAFPVLGILPLASSAALGLLATRRDLVAALGSPFRALSPSNVFFADLLLAGFHLVFLVISWVMIREPRDRGQIVLGTYGTVPMMVNTGIHLYILFPQVVHMLVRRTCDCPHCQAVSKTSYFSSGASEYTPLSDGDTEPEVGERDVEAGR